MGKQESASLATSLLEPDGRGVSASNHNGLFTGFGFRYFPGCTWGYGLERVRPAPVQPIHGDAGIGVSSGLSHLAFGRHKPWG